MFPVLPIPRIALSALAFVADVSGALPANGRVMTASSTRFSYEPSPNATLAGLSIGETVIEPGTYNFNQLEAIAPGKFFDNGGSITVAPVPEPSAAALALVACHGAAGVHLHRRNKGLREV